MNNYQNFSIDDIIFENRNKDYGAYQLRQIVDRNTGYGFLLSTSAIIVFAIIISFLPQNAVPVFKNPIYLEPKNIEVEVLRPKRPEVMQQKQISKAATVQQRAFTEVQATNTTAQETSVPKQEELLTAMVSNVNNTETVVTATVSTETVKTGIETSNTVSTELPEKIKIEKWVEIMPSFVGGNEALLKYLKKNITMDTRDVENGIYGKVIVQFYVDIDGSIKEAKVIKDNAGGRCAERALAAISKMPKWNPGRQGDKPVRVYYSVPITFQVN